jgi:hypothetical protein
MKTFWPALLVLLLFAAPTVVQAQFSYTTNDGAITITAYLGAAASVTIPAAVDDLPVTDIETNAFAYDYVLISVTIPGSVTNIGEEAFYYCTSLTSVTIPGSVTSIGANAFQN